jgi:hypothetical protein
MMDRQYILCAIVLSILQKQKMCWLYYIFAKLNDYFTSHTIFFAWCWHFLPFLHNPMPMVYFCICCNFVLLCGFVSHLCWNVYFERFNSPKKVLMFASVSSYVNVFLVKLCLQFELCIMCAIIQFVKSSCQISTIFLIDNLKAINCKRIAKKLKPNSKYNQKILPLYFKFRIWLNFLTFTFQVIAIWPMGPKKAPNT